MSDPILYDSHMHTPLCKHAKGEPEEYAKTAEKRGLKGIIFTCHNPGPNGWSERVRMSLDQFDEYVAMVERARKAWNGRVDIQLGLESDYMPGMEQFLTDLHARADLSYVLGSVHPQLDYYKEAHFQGDILRFQKTYFQHLYLAAESGLFDALAHPDLVKLVYPDQWNPNLLRDEIKQSLSHIAQTGVALEINTSGLNRTFREIHPNRFMLKEIKARNIPVVLGSDAHAPRRVAADFEQAIDLLEEVGFTHVCYFIERRRHEVDLKSARASLQPIRRLNWL